MVLQMILNRNIWHGTNYPKLYRFMWLRLPCNHCFFLPALGRAAQQQQQPLCLSALASTSSLRISKWPPCFAMVSAVSPLSVDFSLSARASNSNLTTSKRPVREAAMIGVAPKGIAPKVVAFSLSAFASSSSLTSSKWPSYAAAHIEVRPRSSVASLSALAASSSLTASKWPDLDATTIGVPSALHPHQMPYPCQR